MSIQPFTFKPHFRFALVLLTTRCNLACKHCYVESGPKDHEGLSRERALQLVDDLSRQFGKMHFTLSGGEALVRAEDCLAASHRCEKLLGLHSYPVHALA